MITGWKMTNTMLKHKIANECQHCSEWMGNDHNYEDCYIKNLRLRCGPRFNSRRAFIPFPDERDYKDENYLKNELENLGIVI